MTVLELNLVHKVGYRTSLLDNACVRGTTFSFLFLLFFVVTNKNRMNVFLLPNLIQGVS